jgi:hypothetical protein
VVVARQRPKGETERVRRAEQGMSVLILTLVIGFAAAGYGFESLLGLSVGSLLALVAFG